ncbi:MAG: dTMP kinase [Myxococcota bacterium]|jgi:dTMP kinase
MPAFIVVEGLDGAGTTTQVERLVARLRGTGRAVLRTREPTGRAVGKLIRRVLAAEADAPSPTALPWLFAADRSDHLEAVIAPALARGEVVVSDRYYHSSLAYQSLVQPLAQVHALNATFRAPDLTVFVHVPPAIAIERIERRGETREIFERREQLERIDAAYSEVLAFLTARGERIAQVDGTLAPDAVHAAVSALVDGVL